MSYIGKTPTSVPLTSSDITDGIISTDKLAANAVVTSKITDATISNADVNATLVTGQTAETSIADGDTILIHDASASALRKMTKANFVSGVGGTNTPAFHVGQASAQSIANNTYTKITLTQTETLDTDNAFASSRFTPQTAGYYFVYGMARLNGGADFDNMNVAIYKNSDRVLDMQTSYFHYETRNVFGIVNLNGSSDYIELFIRQLSGSSMNTLPGDIAGAQTYLGGYRIIT